MIQVAVGRGVGHFPFIHYYCYYYLFFSFFLTFLGFFFFFKLEADVNSVNAGINCVCHWCWRTRPGVARVGSGCDRMCSLPLSQFLRFLFFSFFWFSILDSCLTRFLNRNIYIFLVWFRPCGDRFSKPASEDESSDCRSTLCESRFHFLVWSLWQIRGVMKSRGFPMKPIVPLIIACLQVITPNPLTVISNWD